MKETAPQRQDVAFLAVVVAVLAVAVALFVGMRSIQKQRPEKPAAKGGKPAFEVALSVNHGRLELKEITLRGAGGHRFSKPSLLGAGESFQVEIVKPKG